MNTGLMNMLKKTIKCVAFCAACATTLQTCNCNANCEQKCGCEDKKVAKSENVDSNNTEAAANSQTTTDTNAVSATKESTTA